MTALALLVALGVAESTARPDLLANEASQPCAKSWLGYQCTQLVCGRIRMHWSLGGPPPTGPGCSFLSTLGANSTAKPGSPDPSSSLLHVALQTDVGGYVAVSWAAAFGVMAPADAVVGFAREDGSASVRAYSIAGWSPNDVQPDAGVDVTHTGLEAGDNSLTVCFTRDLTQLGKQLARPVSTLDITVMNFVASTLPFKQVHLMRGDYKCSARLVLARPGGGADDGAWRPGNTSGASAAAEAAVVSEQLSYMRAHGALQLTGWLVLVPAGVLAARHRWLFAGYNLQGMWFQAHRAVQALACVLIYAGFILPYTSFDSTDEDEAAETTHEDRLRDPLLQTHASFAITLVSVLGCHLAIALVRPKPDSPRRWIWNLLHWWAGRTLVLLAVVNVCIGVSLWRRVSASSGAGFLCALLVFGVGYAGLSLWLDWRAPEGRGREGHVPIGGGGAGHVPLVGLGHMPDRHGRPGHSGEVPLSRMAAAGPGDSHTPHRHHMQEGHAYEKIATQG
ncbi:hypothetical protein HYH03_009787 [Edaphochlamys debaryana]|uniref:Uncharacterized protein n=1 Tax=Edaphochlamys debaryana TaxID=47281 RepID=A0A836BWT0_9CHLO|nr:hypothetical protein HYH03_009787 [Edaphochlamys debaryana]|eukprot:KAG2491830.1 hypothetical protein HYH03_009787 [Edaphochlamys debaryana]